MCRENDVLRDQLKHYVTMIQAQEQHTQPLQEDEQLPTPTEENSRGLDIASAMEEHLQGKLSEVGLTLPPPAALLSLVRMSPLIQLVFQSHCMALDS